MTITLPPKPTGPIITRALQEKRRLRGIWRQARDILRVSHHDPRRAALISIMREAARHRRAMKLPRRWPSVIVLAVATLALSGCGDTHRELTTEQAQEIQREMENSQGDSPLKGRSMQGGQN